MSGTRGVGPDAEAELEEVEENGLRNAEKDLNRDGRGGEFSAVGLTKIAGGILSSR
jgi:hypothetical protein